MAMTVIFGVVSIVLFVAVVAAKPGRSLFG